jgi:hypothetical protein
MEMNNADIAEALRSAVSATRGFVAGEDAGPAAAFAAVQRARVERLGRRHDLLAGRLGSEHPEVLAVQRRQVTSVALGDEVARLARRSRLAGPAKPHEIRVAGQVLGGDGAPLPGVRVRLYDRDVVDDDLLADVHTDEVGGYAAVFHVRDYHESGEGKPEIYVVLDDARGERLADTRARVPRESGVASMLRIVLRDRTADDLPPADEGVISGRCVATTTRGTRCKRAARSGSTVCALHDGH